MAKLGGRSRLGAVVVGVIVVVGAGAVVARSAMEDQAKAKVRDVAVGTWRCEEHFEGELQSVYVMGIASDGRIGWTEQVPEDDQPVGTGKMPTRLAERGAWTVDGLTVELTIPMLFPAERGDEPFAMDATFTYTGDADPPATVEIVDHLSGQTTAARWSADIADDEATFVEVERANGEPGVMDYACARRSSDEPELVRQG
ncbi:hypothetical protein [Aquihabitans sp. McL0605]|uniref:hypothetical protein n=1 Tax=Aquihabitans sp. McL0605 TaxID=3415671 RepID=UPI003CECAA95